MRLLLQTTFRSLRVRNFRLFFFGQLISSVGLWMQQIAELWLILKLTDSAAAVGLITVTHFGPILLLGLWGGVIADRVDKRKIMLATQPLLGLIAGGLAIFSATGGVTPGVLYGFSAMTGLVLALDNPARRAFVREMVELEDVPNAVSLVSMLMTSARIVGPALSGILLARSSATAVFAINGFSYLAVLVALLLMRTAELYRVPPVAKGKGQLAAGLRYAWANPGVRLPIVMMAWIGTLSFNFSVLLVLLAEQTFSAGSDGFGTLISLSAIGSLTGALFLATRVEITHRFLIVTAFVFGVVTVISTTAPTLLTMAVLLLPVGAAGVTFIAGAQAATQAAAEPQMQGRVMALFAVVFLGSTPIGGMFAGFQAELMGPRIAFATGGVISILTAVWTWWSIRRHNLEAVSA
jgi:MFS family permease